MIGDILVCYLLQIVFTVGLIVLFGFLIAFCNKRFYANFGNYGRAVCYITGAIGTPLHECAHALFCLIFGHKVTEIKLFQINAADGTLGYVNHSYNPKNIYHKVGFLYRCCAYNCNFGSIVLACVVAVAELCCGDKRQF